MVMMEDRKIDKALDGLLSRQNYLVTQANDLAKSFGNLTVLQHKVLDYCFSFVQKDDQSDKMYMTTAHDLTRHLGWSKSGRNYQQIARALKSLNENTAIYMKTMLSDGSSGILMTSLFDYISFGKSGRIEFSFNRKVAPFVFQLKKNFYSFKLSELATVRSKYTLTMMKLWNANGIGNWKPAHNQLPDARIKGTLAEWESWFLGSNQNGNPKHWTAGVFKRDVLNKAIKELDRLYPNVVFDLTTEKMGVKVTGYQLTIHPLQTNMKI